MLCAQACVLVGFTQQQVDLFRAMMIDMEADMVKVYPQYPDPLFLARVPSFALLLSGCRLRCRRHRPNRQAGPLEVPVVAEAACIAVPFPVVCHSIFILAQMGTGLRESRHVSSMIFVKESSLINRDAHLLVDWDFVLGERMLGCWHLGTTIALER